MALGMIKPNARYDVKCLIYGISAQDFAALAKIYEIQDT